jgi:adenosylcobinamide-GDP ribazoletransferase
LFWINEQSEKPYNRAVSGEPEPEQAALPDPGGARAFLRGARAAVVFLTRLPAGGFPYRASEWRWAAGWFPLVGALVGALAAAVFAISRAAGGLAAAALAVIAALLVTGALHEDGLADSADALGGAPDRERLFAILKDSRIGAFGAVALTMSLVLRVALLARLDAAAPLALVLVSAWSRTSPVWLMASLPYVTPVERARSRPLLAAGRAQAVFATLTALLLTAAAVLRGPLGWRAAALAAAVVVVLALGAARYFRRRAGGITGDFLGATQQVTECGLLLALALGMG